MDAREVIDHTRRWISTFVVGLNLCPFARRVFEAGTVRYIVSDATDEPALLADLARELKFLADTPVTDVETTLLIHPHALENFLDYNDFLDAAERGVDELGLTGIIQIASFHPDYQFADTSADDVANYTNRSPYPMLHLLREESISQVTGDEEEMMEIPRRNIATLRALGMAKVVEMIQQARSASKE